MFDNSMLGQFQKCQMSYYLQYIKGLKKSEFDETNVDMNFGSGVHSALANLYSDGKIKLEYTQPLGTDIHTLENINKILKCYKEKFSEDRIFSVLDIESPIKFKIGDIDFIVKCDAVFKNNGCIYGLEHKTTKQIGYDYYQKFLLAGQISAQCYAIKEKYGQCDGIYVNMIEYKLLKRRPTAEYDEVVSLPSGEYFCIKIIRDYYNRTQQELEDWKQNVVNCVEQINYCIERNKWIKSTSLWGGIICAKCQYKELCKCSIGTDLNEEVLESIYMTCDPLEYLKED